MADELFVNVFGSVQRTELKEVNLRSLSIHELKERIYKTLNINRSEHDVVYGGRVLSDSRVISDYGIKSGATLFVLKKKKAVTTGPPSAAYAPDFVDLMQDGRVQNVVHQMVTNPAYLRAAMPHVAANPQLRSFLMVPEVVRSSDPQTLTRHLLGNPEMVAVGQMFMDTFSCTLTAEEEEGVGASRRGVSREEFIARLVEEATSEERMVEGYENDGGGEEGEGDGDGMMEQVAESQQQMYEQSQALAAHEQQQQEGGGHMTSGDPHQRQNMVTPGDLTSALSSALGQPPPAPPQPPPVASCPSTAAPQSDRVISQDILSNALAGALGSSRGAPPPAQTQGTHPRGPTPGSSVSQSRRDQYSQQLAQLRGMGIVDEAACVHALEATGGNVEAALEVLLGGGL